RRGAGRKPAGVSAGVSHATRPCHDAQHPLHVTLRAVRGLASLRVNRCVTVMRRAFATASSAKFRIVEFSIQTNHVHLLVEAEGCVALARGMQGVCVRLAKAVNRIRAARAGLVRPVSCAGSPDAERGPKRSDLCSIERPETRRGRAGSRSLLLGTLVHGMEG